jgi:hypothetical protein
VPLRGVSVKKKTPQKRRSDWMRQADKYFSLFIRQRDGKCVASGEHAGSLQCAHLVGRSYKAVRTDPANAVALCAKHHVYWTHRPLEWDSWVTERIGERRYAELKGKALAGGRVNWKEEAERWRAEVDEYRGADHD